MPSSSEFLNLVFKPLSSLKAQTNLNEASKQALLKQIIVKAFTSVEIMVNEINISESEKESKLMKYSQKKTATTPVELSRWADLTSIQKLQVQLVLDL